MKCHIFSKSHHLSKGICIHILYLYFVCTVFLRFRMHEVQYVARHDCHKSNTRPLCYFAFQFCQSLQCLYLYLYLYLYLQLYLRMYEGPRLSQKWHLTTLVTPLHRWVPHPLDPFCLSHNCLPYTWSISYILFVQFPHPNCFIFCHNSFELYTWSI